MIGVGIAAQRLGLGLVVGLAAGLGGCVFDERPAELWRPGAAAAEPVVSPTDPAWPADLALPAAFDLPPWLTLPGPGRVAVGWQSAAPSLGWVELIASPDGELEVDWASARRIDSATAGTLHHVALDGLAPATAYRYRVHLHDGGGGGVREGVFVTPGAAAWRFVHMAEFHAPTDADTVAGFADLVRGFRPHLVVESGDMVDDGDDLDQWRSYLRTSSPWISNAFVLPAHSNHVNGPLGNANLLALFELPDNERWYATRYGSVELVTLDSAYEQNPDVATMPDWVRARMAAEGADQAPGRVIAAWHYPACSSSYPSRSGSRRWVLDHLLPAFADSGGPSLILVGHDKYYERSLVDLGGRTVVQVMANAGRLAPGEAGGNEPECTALETDTTRHSLGLYDVDDDAIRGVVIDPDGSEIDRFAIGG